MTNTKRTPGKWRNHNVQGDEYTEQVWTDESFGSVMIATCAGIDRKANARLIAAAPEMLEFINKTLSVLCSTGYSTLEIMGQPRTVCHNDFYQMAMELIDEAKFLLATLNPESEA